MSKKLFRWNKGRQNTGYDVFPFFMSKWLKMDCYLIRISEGVEIPEHNDEVEAGKHYRLNIHFGFYNGGKFHCESYICKLFETLFYFRPDIFKHSLGKVVSGTLYIFSLGFVK